MMKLRVFTAFSGYDSQCMALDRLKEAHPEFNYELIGWSEIDKYAIDAHNAVYPKWSDKNFGDISKIDWTQVGDFELFTYSFPCFVAGTLIHTTRGYIPIEEVVIGDSVLAHDNEYHKVLEVGSRENAPIIKVRGMCFDEILCTPNHPFYVRRRYRYGHLGERRFTPAEWCAAKDLTRDHFVGYAVNQKSEFPKWEWRQDFDKRWNNPQPCKLTPLFTNKSFWYLMGRYVGDGWKKTSRTGNGIVICCSARNEESLIAAIIDCGWHCTISRERTVTKVIICMNELNIFVERYGYYAGGKQIDEETLNLPVEFLESFVNGYVDSDGCFDRSEYRATTISQKLMYGIQQCISKVYKSPVRMYYTARKPKVTIEGRICNQHDSYSIAWHIGHRKQDKAFYEDGYVWFPIKEVIKLRKRATVYNMEVEDAHSYTANGAIVHNCQSISSAGKQAGFEEGSGTRSALLWECKKAIAIKHPKYLLMENVKAITQKKFMPFFVAWQTWLEEQGYKNFWQILNAKNYGVPQNRERCFMVSILDKNAHYEFPKPFELEKRLKDVLEEEVDEGYYLKPQQVERIVAHCDRKVAEGCGFKTNFTPPQGISGAIKTKEGSREYDTYVKLECEGGSEGERLTGREGNISTGNSTDTHERTLQLSEGNSAPPPEIRKQQTEQND